MHSRAAISLLSALTLLSCACCSHRLPSTGKNIENVEDGAWLEYESSPEFPGGPAAMHDYIYDNLRYPEDAYNDSIQGRVIIIYKIDKTGKVDSVRVFKGIDQRLDAEAVRIVRSFPKFTPRKWGDSITDARMTIPIKFSIADYKKRKDTGFPAFQYDNGDDYVKDGMYRIVDERGRIGYADENGNTVITPRFRFGFPFENGKARVTDSGQRKEVEGSRGEYHYWESDNWYYIDKTGRKTD